MRARLLLLSLLSLLAFAAFASSASANQYCVGDFTLCLVNPTDSYPGTRAGLVEAIDAAQTNPGEDTIKIGAVTIDSNSPIAFSAPNDNPLIIQGAGKGQTILHFTQPEDEGIEFMTGGATNSKIMQLTAQLDAASSTGNRWGVAMNGGTISDVDFVVDAASDNDYPATGALLSGGATCEYCSFSVKNDEAYGAQAIGAATVTSSDFRDASGADDLTTGFLMSGSTGTAIVKQSQFTELHQAVRVTNGTAHIVDSLVDMGDHQFAAAVDVEDTASGHNTLDALVTGVTMVGAADGQRAVYAEASTSDPLGEHVNATVVNSLIFLTGSGLPSAVRCVSDGSPSAGMVTLAFSFASDTTPSVNGCTGGSSGNIASGATTADQLFVNWTAGDLRLKPGAPVIDQADPGIDNLSGRLDARGATRVVDGTASGTARMDMGGIEYQDYPPDKPSIGASATKILQGGSVNFTASTIDGNGDTVTYSWDFSDGSTSTDQNPTHTFAKAGDYVVQVRASAGGLMSEVGEIEISVNALVVELPPLTPTPKLTIGKPNKKFSIKLMKNAPAVSTARPKGAYLPLTVDIAGTMTASLVHVKGGYVVGGSCKAKQGKSGAVHKRQGSTGRPKRCDLTTKPQDFRLSAGKNYLTLGKKWKGTKLTPGTYRMKVDGLMGPRMSTNLTVAKQGSTGRTK